MKLLTIFWFIIIACLFWEILFKSYVAVPTDTLVGANLPWRDYKWGYTTGVPVKNPPLSDVFSQFFVWKHLASDLIRSGQLPIWNRYSFSGNALLGTFHTGVLFPAILLLVLLPRFWGWNLNIILSTFFAGWFMCWYLRSRIKSLLAICVGSLIYALSGLMTTWAELGTAVWAMAFIPLLLLVIDRFQNRPKQLYFASIACLVFLIITAGNVQILTYILILIPIYLIFIHKLNPPVWKTFLAIGLGLGLGAIQILPTVGFYRNSIRAQEQFSATINYGLTGLGEFVRMWAADFFGSPVTYNHWGPTSYHENSGYLSTAGFILVVVYLFFRRKSRLGRFFIIMFLGSLFLAFDNPFSHWIFSLNVPLLTYSSASRLFFLTTLAGAVISALALARFQRFSIISLIFIILTLFFLKTVPTQYFNVSFHNSLLPLGILFTIMLFGFIRPLRKLLPLIILVLIIFDLGRYFRKYNPFVPQKIVFPTTSVIKYLQDNISGYRFINESDEIIPPNTWIYYGLESPEGYDPLYSLAYSQLFKVAAADDFFAKPHRYLDMTNIRPEYLDVLSVKYLVAKTRPDTYLSPIKAQVILSGWSKVFGDKSTEIYSNPHVFPKAISLENYQNLESISDLANLLQSADFNPGAEIAFYPPVKSVSAPPVPVKINIISPVSNGLNVRYMATDSGLILVSQGFDPAWKATVNNIKIPVYRANGGLLAVFVPPGANQILKMRYFPDTLLWGALISLISGFFVMVGVKIRS